MFVEDVSDHWAKATIQIHFLSLFFTNNDLSLDLANSRTDQAESGPVGPLSASVCLPECCCPFRLQLHFHLNKLIVAAMPRGPVEEAFKAVPFCSFYGPQTMAPLGQTRAPAATGHCRATNQTPPPLFFDLSSQQEPRQSRHEPPVCPNCTTCFMNVYLRQQAFSK